MSTELASQLTYWQQHQISQTHSGLSKMEYCKRHGIVYSQFLYWCKKEDEKLRRNMNVRASHQEFIPIKMQHNEIKKTLSLPEQTQSRHKNMPDSSTNILCSIKLKQGHELFIYNAAALKTVLQLFTG